MNIFGVGTDIVSMKRIQKILKKYNSSFKRKIFSHDEITYCESKKNSLASYAKRFAAKEAFTKALGTGFGNKISLKDIEVINNKSGKPNIKLTGYVAQHLKKKIKNKKFNVHLSLSEDKPWACATVIISHN